MTARALILLRGNVSALKTIPQSNSKTYSSLTSIYPLLCENRDMS